MTVSKIAASRERIMKMCLSIFRIGFNSSKCKTMAKMAVARIKLLRNKRQVVVKQMRRDIALLLQSGQDATARIRVEHVIREQNIMAANEFIELFCELVVARLSIISKRRECPEDLKEGISSLIFAAPRCADIPELLDIRDIFEKKYGKDFVSAATDLRPSCGVNRMLIDKLSVRTPSGEVKLKVMKEIAKEYQIVWDTTESETELLKPPEELIEGPKTFVSAGSMPVKLATPQTAALNMNKTSSERSIYSEESDSEQYENTACAARAAEESATKAIAAAQAAAYLANRESNHHARNGNFSGGPTGNFTSTNHIDNTDSSRKLYESRSFKNSHHTSNETNKVQRRHSYNVPPTNNTKDIKFDESDCDEEIEVEDEHLDPSGGTTNVPPPPDRRPPSPPPVHRAHPKLPDYDDITARFEALKFHKSNK